MTINYQIWIDVNRDGLETSDEVITDDIIDLKWRLGMAQPYDTMAPPGWAEIVLDARSGAYTGSNAEILMGCRVTIVSIDGFTTTTHFVGFIGTIIPAPGMYGPCTVLMKAQTRDAALAFHSPTESPLPLSDARTMVRQALVGSGMPYRAMTGYTFLDTPGGVVGSKLLTDVEDFTGTPGLATLAYGGVWNDNTAPSAQTYIQQIMDSERGRFFCGRDGTLTIHNRHFLLKQRFNQANVIDDMTDLTVSSGANVINDIEIHVVPRRVGSAGSLLWTLPRPLVLAPGETRHVQITFRDDLTRLVGVLAISHYLLTAYDDTGTTDVTKQVDSWLSNITLTGVMLSLRHQYSTSVELTSVQIYGTPLFCELPQTSHMVDMASVAQYGRRHQTLNLAALSTLEQADDIARFELSRRKAPRTRATSVTITTQTHPVEALALSIYDRVRVGETQSLPISDYVICAEEHHVDWGAFHRVTWLLEPVEDIIFAMVGGTLDDRRVVAY